MHLLEVRGGLTLERNVLLMIIQCHALTEMIQRVIVHPSFKNCSFDEAEKALSKMDQGETIFRPSSKVSRVNVNGVRTCMYMYMYSCTCVLIILSILKLSVVYSHK